MKELPRRDVLKGAMYGGILWPLMSMEGKNSPMPDMEGQKISRVKDAAAPTTLEREHAMTVEVPAEIVAGEPFRMHINMAGHPMTLKHHISNLRVYVDRELVTFMTLAPTWQLPEVTFTLTMAKGQVADVVVECNQHGFWAQAAPLFIIPSAPGPVAG